MQKVLVAIFLVLITFVGCSSQSASTVIAPSSETINADQLMELVNSGTRFVLLDVREPKELHEFGTLEGYVNIPIEQLENRIAEIPKGVPIVAVCRTGHRAQRAVEMLAVHGYNNIKSGGLLEYKDKGYELIYPSAD